VPKRILVVEDDATIRDILTFNLKKEGYVVTVAQDGADAVARARSSRPDLILLDLMLPELNGLEVCRILRQEGNVPIIMLTAKESEVDKVVGLQLGADDYITKPFSLRELCARMTSVLRRSEQRDVRPEVEEDRLGRLKIDRAGHRAMVDDVELKLTPKEWELLAYLVRRPGRVFTREILLEQVWGYNYLGDRKTVDVHIRWLRRKIELDVLDLVGWRALCAFLLEELLVHCIDGRLMHFLVDSRGCTRAQGRSILIGQCRGVDDRDRGGTFCERLGHENSCYGTCVMSATTARLETTTGNPVDVIMIQSPGMRLTCPRPSG